MTPNTNQATVLSHYVINRGSAVTMTSREIADLVESRHDVVKLSIERLAKSGVISQPPMVDGPKAANGVVEKHYLVGERDSYVVVAQLSPEFTATIVDHWQELKRKLATGLPNFSDPAEAAIAWAEQYRARQAAESTKAQIGNKREATAMATASVAVRKANQLEIELDRSKEYATVKRMEMLHHGVKFKWQILKSTSTSMDIPPIDVFDQNYGTVKAYHADVWAEAFAIQIGGAQ